MRQRRHLKLETETGTRTLFFVDADNREARSIHHEQQFASILDKNDYLPSQQFVEYNPQASFLVYPSCRDPLHRDNAAILEIRHLAKYPKWESSIKYFYNYENSRLTWINYQLRIDWKDVS